MHILLFFVGLCLGSVGGFLLALLLLHARAQTLAEEVLSQHRAGGARNGEWERPGGWTSPPASAASSALAK
jgi:8-oxo-dGTP pyrophosphatase MutT (NUDIX family)